MKKPKLVLWGNCQAGYMAEILRASSDMCARFEISDYLNFSTPGIFEPGLMPDEELAECQVLIYNKVYGDNAPAMAAKLAALPATALRIPIPYLKSNLYWPFFNAVVQPLIITEKYPWGLLSYRSPILDAWTAKGLSDDAIVQAFTALDPSEHLNLDLLEKDTQESWKRLERESEGKLKFAAHIMEHWRSSMQFYIYNHASKPLLLHIASQILALLDAPPLDMRAITKCRCGQHITYPVHPGAARYYGISFAKPGTRYGLDGKHYTFEEFIRFYLSALRAEASGGQGLRPW